MLRRLCKLALLPGLLALGLVAHPAQAQAPAAGVAAPAGAAPEAAIWAATARYVYQDDLDLKPMLADLLATTQAATVEGFRKGLNRAVTLEGKKPKDSHVFMFQTKVFDQVQAQHPASPVALATAIETELLRKHPERQSKPTYQAFVADINRLAAPEAASSAPALAGALPANAGTTAVATPAATSPADTIAAPAPAAATLAPPAAPTSPWLWLALGLSGLSLAAVAVLWNKLSNTRHKLSHLQHKWESSSHKNVDGDGFQAAKLKTAVEREVSRQIEQYRAAQQAQAAAAPATAAPAQEVAAPAIAPAPAPRQRIQYVSEAPFNNNFPARALSDQPGSYSMFAIESSEQQPDQGTFAVTGNLASHVRDHRSVLEPVCEYVGGYPSGSETRVVTEQPGLVRRRGADWEVVQRAKVRFE